MSSSRWWMHLSRTSSLPQTFIQHNSAVCYAAIYRSLGCRCRRNRWRWKHYVTLRLCIHAALIDEKSVTRDKLSHSKSKPPSQDEKYWYQCSQYERGANALVPDSIVPHPR